jgi:hypothetical protein
MNAANTSSAMIRASLISLLFLVSMARAHESPIHPLVLGDYETVSEVGRIPSAVIGEFKTGEDFGAAGLAGIGEPFNAFDVVTGGLPCSRLIRAGHVGDLWFVHYERGCSRLHAHSLDIFQLENGGVTKTWSYISPLEKSIQIQDLIRFVEEGNRCLVSPLSYLVDSEVIDACILSNAN